jgi:hypothetical protein
VIRQLADRLEMHRLRAGNPVKGSIFKNSLGNPQALGSMVNRVILPALNCCEAQPRRTTSKLPLRTFGMRCRNWSTTIEEAGRHSNGR